MVNSDKIVGVFVDNSLKWSDHIKQINKQSQPILYNGIKNTQTVPIYHYASLKCWFIGKWSLGSYYTSVSFFFSLSFYCHVYTNIQID